MLEGRWALKVKPFWNGWSNKFVLLFKIFAIKTKKKDKFIQVQLSQKQLNFSFHRLKISHLNPSKHPSTLFIFCCGFNCFKFFIPRRRRRRKIRPDSCQISKNRSSAPPDKSRSELAFGTSVLLFLLCKPRRSVRFRNARLNNQVESYLR